MTAVTTEPVVTPHPAREPGKGSLLLRLFRTTDHEQFGILRRSRRHLLPGLINAPEPFVRAGLRDGG
jgi:hypothetical protein